ncbi:helix-turn-helix domain-containing protein [Streptomyces sp. NPDC059582]|uniref:helix-turn-helix domain-containing protein n=1 Tax=Streptomyces sp. NPDC059582 TaxID=3346875 RepID=UPI0036B5A5ED
MSAPVQVGPLPSGGGPGSSPDWDDVLADIGDRIRAERHARSWSQNELGLRAGLSIGTVRRLEDGQTTLRSFVAACVALHVNIGSLLSGEWQMPAVKPRLTPAQARVLKAVAAEGSPTLAADRLRIPMATVTSRLAEIYRLLDVTHLPRGRERFQAAVRVAREQGLLNTRTRTS